jgi:hypothetical protein
MVIEKLNIHKLIGIDKIPAEMIKQEVEKLVLRSKSI